MRLEDSQLVSGSQRGPTVYVDADLPGANRIARFLGDEGWEVVSGPSEIPPMSIPIVFFGPSTDVELWAKLLGSGGLRAIAVGDNADSDVVVGALEVGFDQFDLRSPPAGAYSLSGSKETCDSKSGKRNRSQSRQLVGVFGRTGDQALVQRICGPRGSFRPLRLGGFKACSEREERL